MMALVLSGRQAVCGRPGCGEVIGSTEPTDPQHRVRLDERRWQRSEGNPLRWQKLKTRHKVRRVSTYDSAAGPIAIPGALTATVEPNDVIVCPKCGTVQQAVQPGH